MAVKQFYFKNTVPNGATLHRSLQDGGTAPSTATTTTGWVPGSNVIGQSCIQNGGLEIIRTDAQWSATLRPSTNPSQTLGDCWRSENTLNGTFANTNWAFAFGVRSVTAAYTGRFKLAVRVWRATNANGSGATELTGARVASSATSANLSTSADTTVTVTWTPGATKTLTDEYLFVNVGIEVTAAGSGNTQDVDFRVGSAYTLTTPDFTALLAGQVGVSARGTLLNGVTLSGAAGAGVAGTLLSGSQRAYLSWAQLTLPATSGTNRSLAGLSAASAGGSLASAGAQRAYLSWARLTLPPTSSAGISGLVMASARGTLSALSGTVQLLTGLAGTSAAGTITKNPGVNLITPTIVASAGTIQGSDETIIFLGSMVVTVFPPLTAAVMSSARGTMGIIKTGETLAPLIGLSATSVGSTLTAVLTKALAGFGAATAPGLLTAPQSLLVGIAGLSLTISEGELVVTFVVGQSAAASAGSFGKTLNITLTGLAGVSAIENIAPLWQDLPPEDGRWTPVNRAVTIWSAP